MTLQKMVTLSVVDSIETQLPSWEKLGFRVVTRVPESGPAGFVILSGPTGELMLQTRASLREDLPDVAKREPKFLLYADVDSLEDTRQALPEAEVIVKERETFYGARESWLALPGGTILGLATH
ncbi:MAG TPA: hypothetical protein VHZ95_20000 [Polyangiales bacterium]|nr:hypothetical protein [Polyangiales bacterium]